MGCYVAWFGCRHLGTAYRSLSHFQFKVSKKTFFCDNNKPRSQPAHQQPRWAKLSSWYCCRKRQKYYIYHIVNCLVYNGIDSRRIKCVYGEWVVLYWQRKPDVSEEISPTATSSTLAQGPNPNGTYDIKCYLLLVIEAALERNSCRRALLSADILDSGVAGFEDWKSLSSLLYQCLLGILRGFRLLCRFE